MSTEPEHISDLAPPRVDDLSSDDLGDTSPGGGSASAWVIRAVIALVVVAVVAFILVRGDDSNPGADSGGGTEQPALPPFPADPVGVEGLQALVAMAGQAVYWVGPEGDAQYLITRRDDGGVQIDYLTGKANSPAPLVGTYAVANAYEVTLALRDSAENTVTDIPGGGVASVANARPTNVYVAFPGVDYQIEIFHPDPDAALKLATDGRVVPVG